MVITMNKTYKIIWNASTGTWVAVSELVKSKTKSNRVKLRNFLIISLVSGISPAQFAAINMGIDAVASGNEAVALGDYSQATGSQSTAIGGNTIASGYAAIAIGGDDLAKTGSAAIAERDKYKEITGTTLRTAFRSTTSSGTASIALGTTAVASGAFSTAMGVNSSATGFASLAFGIQATATEDVALALGASATATGKHVIAIGTSATGTIDNAIAIGSHSQATILGATAIGQDATANVRNSIALGTSSMTTAQSGSAYLTNIAASATNGVVSVGNAGLLRRIQNVADGAADQDAVTVSQLKVVNNTLAELASSSITFKDAQGNTSENRLGTTFSIIGDTNIATTITNGQAQIALNKDLKGMGSIETTDGTNTTIYDANGLNINQGAVLLDSNGLNIAGITINQYGINANNTVIKNVKNGDLSKDSTDAVNGSQLYDVKNDLSALSNAPLTFKDANGGESVNKLGSELLVVGDQNITTAVTDGQVGISLNKDLKDLSSMEMVTGTNTTIYDGNGININNGDVTLTTEGLNTGGVTVSKDGINANYKNISNLADAVEDRDAVNYGQVKSMLQNSSNEMIDLGFSLTSEDGSSVKNNLGESIGIVGDENISTTVENNKIKINLAKDLKVDSIHAGESVLNSQGLYILGGPNITQSGIDAGGKVLSNVANGNIAADSKDAVNGSQLNETNQTIVSFLGGGAAYDNITQSFNAPTYHVGNHNYGNVGDALSALNQSNINTNQRIDTIEQALNNSMNDVNKRMDDLRKEARSGIAAAMAIGGLPQPSQAGKSMMSAGVSTHRGEGAFAFGVSGITQNEKYIYKAGAGVDTQSSFSGTLSVGYQC